MKLVLPLLFAFLAACSSSQEENEELNRLEDFRQRATQYYSAGDLDRAEQQARRGLALEPENGMLNLILGRTLLRRRDLRSVAASREYLEIAHTEVADWRSALSLGESHLRYAKFLLGEAALLEVRVRELAGDNQAEIGELQARSQRVTARANEHLAIAMPLLEYSNTENPEYTFTLNLLASGHAVGGDSSQALEILDQLVGLLEDSRRWKNRQLALQEMEVWQEEQLRSNLRDDIELEVDSLGLAATLLMDASRFSEAEKHLTTILNLDAELDREYYNRGICRYRQGKLLESAQDMEEFVRKTEMGFDSVQVERAMQILDEFRERTGEQSPSAAMRAGRG